MNFSNVATASIDYSPTLQARDVTLVLEEQELANASYNQMERFVRVWYSERSFYAPNLINLNIVFRPTVSANKDINMSGIQEFLRYFKEKCMYHREPTTLYMDNWSDTMGRMRSEYMNEPSVILKITPHEHGRLQAPHH